MSSSGGCFCGGGNHGNCSRGLIIYSALNQTGRLMIKPVFFSYEKKKAQISCVVTVQLISAFVFDTWIAHVHSIYFLNLNFKASSHLLWLDIPVCVVPDRKPQRQVSRNAAQIKLMRLKAHLVNHISFKSRKVVPQVKSCKHLKLWDAGNVFFFFNMFRCTAKLDHVETFNVYIYERKNTCLKNLA